MFRFLSINLIELDFGVAGLSALGNQEPSNTRCWKQARQLPTESYASAREDTTSRVLGEGGPAPTLVAMYDPAEEAAEDTAAETD